MTGITVSEKAASNGSRRLRRRTLVASVAVVGALVLSGCWSENQQKDMDFINQSRGSGRRALNGDDALMQKAQAWAEHMSRTGVLEHTGGGNKINTSGISNWCAVGENVGYGSSTMAVHNAFMASSGHRANILGNYDRVGTGVVRVGSVVWVSEIYVRSC